MPTVKFSLFFNIKNDLKVPVKFVGVGEQIDDLQPFNPEAFAQGLFDNEVVKDEDETNPEDGSDEE